MFSFMFGVLGSLIFWAIYIPLSFFMAICVMRLIGDRSRAYITLSTGSSRGIIDNTWNKDEWEVRDWKNWDGRFFPKQTGTSGTITTWDKFEVIVAVIWWMFWWPIVLGIYVLHKIIQLVIVNALFELIKLCFHKTPKVSIKMKQDEEDK